MVPAGCVGEWIELFLATDASDHEVTSPSEKRPGFPAKSGTFIYAFAF